MSTTHQVQFAEFSAEEQATIQEIVDRALEMRIYEDSTTVEMDIAAVCAHTPLRLKDLLNASPFNFIHDLAGIRDHLDRTTGLLEGYFLPRSARPGFNLEG